MKKFLFAVASIVGITLGLAAAPANAGVIPWSDDSVCDTTDRYNGQGYAAWQGDLCNQFEVKQAQFLNDVIRFAYSQALGERAVQSPAPWASENSGRPDGLGSNFYVNEGGLDGNAGGARSVWFDAGGVMEEAAIGAPERNAAQPQNRLLALTGRTLEEWYAEFVASGRGVESVYHYLADGCNPILSECEVFVDSTFEYDAEFVAKRYPLTPESVAVTLMCTQGGKKLPCSEATFDENGFVIEP